VRRALIGSTGFVGGALARQAPFDALYHSTDIAGIAGRSFDLVVCAGAPAAKWKANQQPEADLANLEVLMGHLATVRARRFVLVSTVDVYPTPVGVDEETPIDRAAGSAYGRHRLLLERFARDRFDATVLRLPALFGEGLRKNAIYDLLHDNCVDALQPRSSFQFYDVARLWSDLERVGQAGLRIVNLATEPLVLGDVARAVFGRELPPSQAPVARYDFRSRHSGLWGRGDGYLCGRDAVLEAMAAFVRTERAKVAR
jgi:nucleoside-diphosphate-sugar epimerase